jgi:hypothetical protein
MVLGCGGSGDAAHHADAGIVELLIAGGLLGQDAALRAVARQSEADDADSAFVYGAGRGGDGGEGRECEFCNSHSAPSLGLSRAAPL